MPPPPRVAVLGLPGSGADELARALRAAAPGGPGIATLVQLLDTQGEDAMAPALRQLADSGCTSALLLGLDHPQPGPAQEQQYARLRALLDSAGLPYRVLYGNAAQRLRQARAALWPAANATETIADSAYPASAGGIFSSDAPMRPVRLCEKCSDPDCEYRLFKRLLP